MARDFDPDHKELHRVTSVQMERYKAGLIKTVVAVCGKDWAPTFPVNMRGMPRCEVCFPTERFRYAIAS